MIVLLFQFGNLINEVIVGAYHEMRLREQSVPVGGGELLDEGYDYIGPAAVLTGEPEG